MDFLVLHFNFALIELYKNIDEVEFSRTFLSSLMTDKRWLPSPVEDPIPGVSGPDPSVFSH